MYCLAVYCRALYCLDLYCLDLYCLQVLADFKGRLSFTCVEMRDCEHPPEGRCSPQGLLQQVRVEGAVGGGYPPASPCCSQNPRMPYGRQDGMSRCGAVE
jgi:hypothetical protein